MNLDADVIFWSNGLLWKIIKTVRNSEFSHNPLAYGPNRQQQQRKKSVKIVFVMQIANFWTDLVIDELVY